MSGSGNATPDESPSNIRNLDAARQRRRNSMGKTATNSNRQRRFNAKVTCLFPEEEPDFSEEELMELEDAFTALDSVSGHRYNAIKNWLAELGEAYGDRTERTATVRIADFIKSNPHASLSDIRAIIFEPPF